MPGEDKGPAQEPLPEEAGVLLEAPATLEPTLQALTRAFESFVSTVRVPADLSPYRSVTAARGLQECQAMLDGGWDILHADFCEEVRRRSGVGRQAAVLAWTPYFIMGRRETLLAQDKAAIIQADDQRAMNAGVPMREGEDEEVDEEAGQEIMPPPAAAGTPANPATPRGRRVVTAQGPRSIGAEGQGALAGR
jgi:hypothetical protein